MRTTEWFPSLNAETAPAAARPILAASAKRFGFLPAPVARAAHSPVLLKHLMAGFAAFDQSSLSPFEREVVAFAVAFEIGCHYCMAMHSALNSAPEQREVVAALRAGSVLPDARLEALRQFARAVVRDHGRVAQRDWQALAEQGISQQQALDVVLGVGVYLLSTLTNIVTDAPLDAPFTAFEWHKPI